MILWVEVRVSDSRLGAIGRSVAADGPPGSRASALRILIQYASPRWHCRAAAPIVWRCSRSRLRDDGRDGSSRERLLPSHARQLRRNGQTGLLPDRGPHRRAAPDSGRGAIVRSSLGHGQLGDACACRVPSRHVFLPRCSSGALTARTACHEAHRPPNLILPFAANDPRA